LRCADLEGESIGHTATVLLGGYFPTGTPMGTSSSSASSTKSAV
jgi:hypothetical protein